ncbi:hypothetical protein [Polyangium sorediatum]|uniref:Lipoprotein n=1 Tax=Polyangium sorediatum TaxID=889274 RepID=A0ABT6NZR6_9BACT|nr:hypothetical protein [Polyangium sorediatum]MDI1433842.1 hypothetical protein [Polyangium sorediatum]
MAPFHRSCTATVAGQTFYDSEDSCGSPLTGVLEGLCAATIPLPTEIPIHCENGGASTHILDTETGVIRE